LPAVGEVQAPVSPDNGTTLPIVNGVHDMGGQHGHGAVLVEAAEPVFHQPWEGRVYALMILARGRGVFNLDEMRRAIEGLPPAQYLGSSYYERWLAALEALLEEDSTFYGDLFAHVVAWRGDLYLEDGLHRALRAALQQRQTMHARVLQLGD
jgi:hypothetical protein